MLLYLDAGALVKRYVAESGSEDVAAFTAEASALATSILSRVETVAALSKAIRVGTLVEEEAIAAAQVFRDQWPDFIRVQATERVVARADQLAWRFGLRGYDVTASEVLTGLVDAGLPIGEHIAYTAETDPNELLGRPGGYTSKVNFRDTRLVEQVGDFSPRDGGGIEVFPDTASAEGRAEYLKSIGQVFTPGIEYHYIMDNVLLHLSHRLLPEQGDEYHQALVDLLAEQP